MKMSDVFDLPLKCVPCYTDGGSKYFALEDDNCSELDGSTVLTAAAHAINHHDAMVTLLEELSSMLTDINAHVVVNEIEDLLREVEG